MKIDPTYMSVGELFRHQPMFFIPKYQRAYAWEADSVLDFINDLEQCFNKRKSGEPIKHFFGGILSIKYSVPHIVNQHKYEIIDGQQRIVTFTLLISCIIKTYEEIASKANSQKQQPLKWLIQKRIENLRPRFIEFEQEVQRQTEVIKVLKLSKSDNDFYQKLLCAPDEDKGKSMERDSHIKLKYAYKELQKWIKKIIEDYSRSEVKTDGLKTKLEAKIDALEIIQNILEEDFTILHMVTESKNDAYRLFQVINDRGRNLTNGDLLKAKTLEILEGFEEEQNEVEQLWDNILADEPSNTDNYLNWIYESHKGQRAKRSALFDDFLKQFFPKYESPKLTKDDAQQVCDILKNIFEDINKCRKLEKGEWLFENSPSTITSWDKNLFKILLVDLKHTLSIPLFLTASKLEPKTFSEIVQMVEKVFFRYKLICNEPPEPLKKIYRDEAVKIRKNSNSYQIGDLRGKLKELMDSKAPEEIFKNKLHTFEYNPKNPTSNQGNKKIKYFLTTVEYFYSWYKQGAEGQPICVDKSREYNDNISIEHIYPQTARPPHQNKELEPIKNKLGNLTIINPRENKEASNKSFEDKKEHYAKSSVELTKEIGLKESWTKDEVDKRTELLIDAAVKIFCL